ncbi:hypothetical protein ACH5RR_023206 [Cinchona calisaya]|uniref:Uncharacterized protein n=1 Tax=Cinchona calisaya TaxID=153742 RepID=A0ABD2ZB35_9GENT
MAASRERQLTATSREGSGSHGEPNQITSVKLAIDGRGKLGHQPGEVKKPEAGDPWMSKPLPVLREAFSEVRREEIRRKVMLKSDLDMKLAPENSSLATIRNEPESDKKKKPWCDHYKKHWHTWDTYWKIHRKPTNWKKKNTTNNRAFQATIEEQGQ